jgi:Protein of unknown function (DUF1236)
METAMKPIVLVLALLSTCASAAAQIVITPQQERAIYEILIKERVWPSPPPGVTLLIGAEIPREVELFEVPTSIDIAPVRRYRYTVVNDRVLLVDAGTRQIMWIIPRR